LRHTVRLVSKTGPGFHADAFTHVDSVADGCVKLRYVPRLAENNDNHQVQNTVEDLDFFAISLSAIQEIYIQLEGNSRTGQRF
jgi:hypothetical protein